MNDNLTRRGFLVGCCGGLVASAWGNGALFTGAARDYDPNLSVFLSDLHLWGDDAEPKYPEAKLAMTVGEILKMNPLPTRVVIFGDVAHLFGRVCDYQAVRPYIQQLEAAKIQVTLATGNHDRRANMMEAFPQCRTTRVPGCLVSKVDLGTADLVMLDSLQETPANKWITPGALDDAQQEWISAELSKLTRPTFICAHHPVGELKVKGEALGQLILNAPNAVAYIHGHEHRWYRNFMGVDGGGTKRKLVLGLPSTGVWGDIGFVVFRTGDGFARADLKQNDYYCPKMLPADKVPPEWRQRVKKNQGQFVTIPYA